MRFSQLLLAAMVLITFVSVVGRTFLNRSVPDDLLISQMLMVAVVFLPLGWVQSMGAHLEVTVLTDFFSQEVQTVLVSLGLILGIVLFGTMAVLSWHSAYEAFELDEIAYASAWQLREWPVKFLIPFGLAWWCLRMLVHLLWPTTRPETESEYEQALHDTAHLSTTASANETSATGRAN